MTFISSLFFFTGILFSSPFLESDISMHYKNNEWDLAHARMYFMPFPFLNINFIGDKEELSLSLQKDFSFCSDKKSHTFSIKASLISFKIPTTRTNRWYLSSPFIGNERYASIKAKLSYSIFPLFYLQSTINLTEHPYKTPHCAFDFKTSLKTSYTFSKLSFFMCQNGYINTNAIKQTKIFNLSLSSKLSLYNDFFKPEITAQLYQTNNLEYFSIFFAQLSFLPPHMAINFSGKIDKFSFLIQDETTLSFITSIKLHSFLFYSSQWQTWCKSVSYLKTPLSLNRFEINTALDINFTSWISSKIKMHILLKDGILDKWYSTVTIKLKPHLRTILVFTPTLEGSLKINEKKELTARIVVQLNAEYLK